MRNEEAMSYWLLMETTAGLERLGEFPSQEAAEDEISFRLHPEAVTFAVVELVTRVGPVEGAVHSLANRP
jgi:hypothetical protein